MLSQGYPISRHKQAHSEIDNTFSDAFTSMRFVDFFKLEIAQFGYSSTKLGRNRILHRIDL